MKITFGLQFTIDVNPLKVDYFGFKEILSSIKNDDGVVKLEVTNFQADGNDDYAHGLDKITKEELLVAILQDIKERGI